MEFMNIDKICRNNIRLRCRRLLEKREKEGIRLC